MASPIIQVKDLIRTLGKTKPACFYENNLADYLMLIRMISFDYKVTTNSTKG